MKIFITGGTGFIGRTLTGRLLDAGHKVMILTRGIRAGYQPEDRISFIEGDSTQKGDWMNELGDVDVIINLAGASIFKRWTGKYKEIIRDSRLLTTQNIVEGIRAENNKNIFLISTSAVGYYGFHKDEELTEEDDPGEDFLAVLSREWEETANKALEHGVRVAICRLGIVLGKDGGALAMMTPLFKYWLGSPLGSGDQFFSWIHIEDLINIYMFLINKIDIQGVYNCTVPSPVTNKEMTKAIGTVMKKPVFMPRVPGFMIRLIMGEFAETLLHGQKVIPKRIQQAGFQFKYANIHDALENIIKN